MARADEAVRRLLTQAPLTGPDDLPAVVAGVAPLVDARDITIFLADYAQVSLVPLSEPGRPIEPAAIDSTLAGRAFTTLEAQRGPGRLWVPLLDGCERLGVVQFESDTELDEGPAHEVTACVAQLLKNRRAYGDKIERLRRREPMQVAAEIVWGLLPSLTFAANDLVVTAVLEPCYDVGGDVFDYALNGDVLSIGLFDTCGHGIKASALASLAVGAYRNARRTGLDLAATAISVDRWFSSEHRGLFTTAVLIELDRRDGRLRTINAGHPGVQLVRDGKAIKELPGPTTLPLGLGYLSDEPPRVHEETLHPGDRLLLYTDGVTEAVNSAGERFGLERLLDLVQRALNDELPTPETMRRLVQAVLDHHGEALQDDATAVLLEWRPAHDPWAKPRPA
ncbi:PP2C family protein-serine/threonine phosphatase [Asanoa sp. NPDC049573]|uniref:PP2C family protein-serine/threonine phosphatase n=1 Tax=Asanoa sp. NPDC049573 TaxID=3155396 RepID=UPI003421114E